MAIAYDNSTKTTSATDVTSLSVSHTCTGSNLTIIAIVTIAGNAATCTGATYNSVAMTQRVLAGPDGDNNKVYIFTLGNPATGANTLSCTFSGNASPVGLMGISLTGTDTSSVGANNTSTPTGASSFSLALTTNAANSWIVDGVCTGAFTGGDNMHATGTNQTIRQFDSSSSGLGSLACSTQTTTTAGSYTGTYDDGPGGSHNWAFARLEIKEPSSASPHSLSSTGVGR